MINEDSTKENEANMTENIDNFKTINRNTTAAFDIIVRLF